MLASSAVELAAKIRQRQLSPVEVVETHIARIQEVNAALNAVVAERFDEARREAREAEARVLAAGQDTAGLPPLLGVPCTVKEFIAVTGMPLSAGVVARRDIRATQDATIVRRVREAGAIILGVTNIPEGGLWMETDNRIYGRTSNPWDLSRTSGGSTGGEGAIVAAGGSAFGIGADIGGSIRIPAAFCGIVGHKPTGRLVPNTGYWPPLVGNLSAYLVCGPMTRKVADLMPILRILAGPDGQDEVVRPYPLGDPQAVDLAKVAVYPVDSPRWVRMSAPVKHAIHKATAALRARGAEVRPLKTRGLANALEIWSAMMADAPGPPYSEVLGNGSPIPFFSEVAKLPFGRSRHTIPGLVMVALETLVKRVPGGLHKLVQKGLELQAELEAELGEHGVLLYPPCTRPAPKHGGLLFTPIDFVCTAIFNVLEFPSTQVPTGFDAGSLPVGVQVVARRGNDHLTIAVAGALEEDLGGWVRAEPRTGSG
jgi:fatty acid amide hydrolase 2